MTLAEKITYYRKKSGLSQDALAEKLNVSRQAISKWETGESVPETKNLLALASALAVTVDWLLSPDEPSVDIPVSPTEQNKDWLNRLPGFIGKLFRQYGWLIGVYMAIGGCSFAFMGGLMKQMFTESVHPFLSNNPAFAEMQKTNPGITIGNFVLILGIALIVVGVVIAIILKRKSKNDK